MTLNDQFTMETTKQATTQTDAEFMLKSPVHLYKIKQ